MSGEKNSHEQEQAAGEAQQPSQEKSEATLLNE